MGKKRVKTTGGLPLLVMEFVKDQEANSIGALRIRKYKTDLTVIKETIYQKEFSELTTEDLEDVVRKIEASEYADWTKHDLKVILRKFAVWLNKKYNKSIDTTFIKITVKNSNKLPEEILTPEEVQNLVAAAASARDKALISVLYESGCRIGELLSLKIKNVEFDEYGAVIIIPNGKTGSRRIRIVSSAPLLSEYINNHPLRGSESYLWVTIHNKTSIHNKTRGKNETWMRIGSQTVRKLLHNVAKEANINKNVYPHLLRHSRATHLAGVLTEQMMKEFFGWSRTSQMPGIYVHLSGKNVDDALLRCYGIKKNEEKTEDMLIKFSQVGVSYPSLDKARFESFVFDFLKTIAEEVPAIKDKFKSMVKERNLEGMFGVNNEKAVKA